MSVLPLILSEPLGATESAFVPNVPLKSVSINSSPALGEEGVVHVKAPPLVSTKYPSDAAAVKLAVLAVLCHEIATDAVPFATKAQYVKFTVPPVEGVCI